MNLIRESRLPYKGVATPLRKAFSSDWGWEKPPAGYPPAIAVSPFFLSCTEGSNCSFQNPLIRGSRPPGVETRESNEPYKGVANPVQGGHDAFPVTKAFPLEWGWERPPAGYPQTIAESPCFLSSSSLLLSSLELSESQVYEP